MGDDISHMWQRHLVEMRDDFDATSVQALPSRDRSLDGGEAGNMAKNDGVVEDLWEETMDSVVGALQELTAYSPDTTYTQSPETRFFTDREDYAETALSSPQNSSWSRTIAPARTTKNRLASHNSTAERKDPPQPLMVEISPRLTGKGKGLEIYYTDADDNIKTLPAPNMNWYQDHTRIIPRPLSYMIPAAPATATYHHNNIHYQTGPQSAPPEGVHVLVLTWAKHDRRGDDGQLLSPSLDTDTERVRNCFKRRGYRVQCRLIPADYPTAAVETMLDRFLGKSTPTSLLVIYYHGFGNMENGRMVFSSGPAENSFFFWEDVRDPIIQAPGDVLLILDCSAAPGIENPEQAEILVEAGMSASPSTSSAKQVLGVCVPPTVSYHTTTANDVMTESLCRALDNAPQLVSVQGLCSHMREDLRGTEVSGRVFVTQLGGGQLLDILLPRLGG
ncbi:hypothetical protein B0H63DRAFT_132667 [Podospora didyma]|uniref:Peptidase C14 caspase domain-containing protein n=1 Tax=Podospora didyma TaxID=330526 RepID=A0AAE0U4Y8_9PEZI|nr:hypothetical protein B0H63DRAFT_132667 [Podospora didyma]